MVDERVVVVGAAGKHDGVASGAASGLDGVRAGLGQQRFERALGFIGLLDGAHGLVEGDAERAFQVIHELAVAVLGGVPMEQRVVEGDAPVFGGVVGAFHHHGIALHHGAHRYAGGRRVLAGHGGDDGHEDAVDAGARELVDVPVHQLRGEADGVGCDLGQPFFEHGACGRMGKADGETERAQQRVPERHGVPERQDARDADGDAAVGRDLLDGPVLEEELLARLEEVFARF